MSELDGEAHRANEALAKSNSHLWETNHTLRLRLTAAEKVVEKARNLRSAGITEDGSDIIPQEFMRPLLEAVDTYNTTRKGGGET